MHRTLAQMPARSFFRDLSTSHERLRDVVAQMKVERDPERLQPLCEELSSTLRRHFQVEDEVLYPTLKEAVRDWEDRVVLIGAQEDHHLIMRVLEELAETPPSDERFYGKVHALDKLWSHHVAEEEDNLYDMARRYLTHEDFLELADRVEEAQERFGVDH